MGYYEENLLHEDSFFQAICSIDPSEKPEQSEEDSTSKKSSTNNSPSGMFEMAKKYDIIKGKFADGFFDALGPSEGGKFKRFKEKTRLLREKIMFEMEDEADESEL